MDAQRNERPGRHRRRRPKPALALAATLAMTLLQPVACRPTAPSPEPAEPELAVLMGELQRHSAKLGYAIEGRNLPLAEFYLAETREALDAVRQVEVSEGMPIAHPLGAIVDPLLPPLADAVAAGRWEEARSAYRNLLVGCNRCHAATGHEFLVITPPVEPAPYNQLFAAGRPAR